MTNELYLTQQGVQKLDMTVIFAKKCRFFLLITIINLLKNIGCQKNEYDHNFGQKMVILTLITIIGLLKNISLTRLSNLGLFASKHIGL